MTGHALTAHAEVRKHQRGVPRVIFDWLEEFGEEHFDGHGGIVCYFNKESKRRLEQTLGRRFIAENARYLNRYLVRSVADGNIITVGVLTKPIRHR